MRDVASGVSFDPDMLEGVLREIYDEEVVPDKGGVSEQLFEATRDLFERATAQGMAQSRNKRIAEETDFLERYTHSIEVFSVFRAHRYGEIMASKLHDDEGNLRSFEEWRQATASIQSHFNRTWLETEYNTAILRAEQAADWQQFERDKDVAPRLTWMPTSSADPREEHAVFWRDALTLPVDDPFWDKHRPGDLWNCKCWLKPTDEPATDRQDIPKGKDVPKPAKGLESNPGKTAEMFSSNQPHYPKPKTCIWLRLAGGKAKNRMGRFLDAAKCPGNCNTCEYIQLASKKDKAKNKELYEKMKLDENYKNIKYDEKTGGLKATHKEHRFDPHKGYYERKAQTFGYKSGHCVILESEGFGKDGERFTDGLWDGRKFEIAGAETATKNNIKKALVHCASKRITEIAVVYFPDVQPDEDTITEAVSKYIGLLKSGAKGVVRFEKICFVFSDGRIIERSL